MEILLIEPILGGRHKLLFQRDKDLGWAIVFCAFLVLLLSSIASSILRTPPKNLPYPVILANSNFEREFMGNVCRLIRYISLGAMAMGVYGIIAWPSGPGSPRF